MNPVKRKSSKDTNKNTEPQDTLGFSPGGVLDGGDREEIPRKRGESPGYEEREIGIQEGWSEEKAMGSRKKEVK